MKIKNVCLSKDATKRVKKQHIKRRGRQVTDWEKIFAKDISDKGLLPKYT